jgi:hypothetical protein
MIGDRQVRHMGTIGGSLANNDPAADYPAAVLGLGATITTNKRKIEADAFFKGLYETALQPGELITSVSFPVPKRSAYVKFKNPASRFAIVGVFVADFGGKARVAVTGAGPSVFRQADMEKALSAKFAPDAVAYEPAAEHSGVEFGRKTRVITRGLRGVLVRRELLNPFRYGFYALQLFSHKVLRRLAVFPLLLLLLVSPLLWSRGLLYKLATLAQAAFYGFGLAGWLLGGTRIGRTKLFTIPFFFCMA